MSERDFQLCVVVGGPNDGDRLYVDVGCPGLTLRRRLAFQDMLRPPLNSSLMEPALQRVNEYVRLELRASDGIEVRSVVIYHHRAMKPWEALLRIVERYRG